MSSVTDIAARGRAWHRGKLAAVCDELSPWEHGIVARAHQWPGFFDYNAVIVDRPTRMSVAELEEVAERYLADVAHRRIDVEDAGEGRRLRSEFERRGWRALVLVWMLHLGELPPPVPAPRGGRLAVEEVPYGVVDELRREWHEEDFPGTDPTAYHEYSRELASMRSARVLAIQEAGRPIGYSQLERIGDGVEVSDAFVTRARRGQGLGTALTTAALRAAAADHRDVWICANDEDRPKALYQRLGFQPVWWVTEFLRLPAAA